MPDPANATLAEAIAHLRSQFGWLLDEFVRGRLVVWTGAKISEGKLPALDGLLKNLLDGIHARVNYSDANCSYLLWLEDTIPAEFWGPIDEAPSTWLHIEKIVTHFLLDYSAILENDIDDGGTVVNLIWDIVKIHELYAPDDPDPDAEHRFLALLMAERVVEQSVTTNWDDLVETAFERTLGTRVHRRLDVLVQSQDLARPIDGPSLFKIHGCARRAKLEPDGYRQYIVATNDQFTKWLNNSNREAIREHLRDIVRSRRVIFVGSSAQDRNIQQNFGKIVEQVDPPGIHPPKVTFCSDRLEQPHRQVLKAIHQNDFTLNKKQFEQTAVLGLYGKPLLGTLYVLTLIHKANAIAKVAEAEFGSWASELRHGIALFERRLCDWFDQLPSGVADEKWRALSRTLPALVSRFQGLFRHAQLPDSGDEYHELWFENVGEILNNSRPLNAELHYSLLALAIVLLGDESGKWDLDVASEAHASAGQFCLMAGGRRIAVFCMKDKAAAWGLAEQQGMIDTTNQLDVAVIHPSGSRTEILAKRLASPAAGHSLPTRTRPLGPTQIWMDDEREAAGDLNALLASLQTQL